MMIFWQLGWRLIGKTREIQCFVADSQAERMARVLAVIAREWKPDSASVMSNEASQFLDIRHCDVLLRHLVDDAIDIGLCPDINSSRRLIQKKNARLKFQQSG